MVPLASVLMDLELTGKRVLVTGGKAPSEDLAEAEMLAQALSEFGVEVTWQEKLSKTTLLKALKWRLICENQASPFLKSSEKTDWPQFCQQNFNTKWMKTREISLGACRD